MTRQKIPVDGPSTPTTYASFVSRALVSDGYPVDSLLAGTGLSLAQLEDPTFQCGFRAKHKLLTNAVQLTGDVHLGPRLARRFKANYIGLPVYAAMNAASFHEALATLGRYLRLTFPMVNFVYPDPLHGTDAGDAAVRLDIQLDLGDVSYFLSSSALVVCETIFCDALARERVVSHAELAARPPRGHRLDDSAFGFPVRFNQPENRLVFSADLLEQPLPGDDPLNHKSLIAMCDAALQETEVKSGVEDDVITLLQESKCVDFSMSEAAAKLGYSERSLRRRLERAGVSYRELVEVVRESRARSLLAKSSLPVGAIAYELGFEKASNFARSFKRWTGVTPREFRQEQHQI